jgi:His/Glu/Gln/Arg/opine family amino acid ABC transporter permease subunit
VAAEDSAVTDLSPPDIRGMSGPFPRGIFIGGWLAIALVLGGTIVLQLGYAAQGGSITPRCSAAGLEINKTVGARGVCNVIEAVKSPAETGLLGAGMLIGLAMMVLGWGSYRRMDTRRKREHAVAGAVLGLQAVAIGAVILWFRASGLLFPFVRNVLNFTFLNGRIGHPHPMLWFTQGAKYTLFMAFSGEVGGILIGLILATLVISPRKVVRAPARAYINFFRGTPLIWQLIFFQSLLTLGFQLNLSTIMTAILVFALNTGAYAAEVFRAGLQSIERGQIEAARSLGMSYFQAMRYAIVPQAVRRVIPPLMNEFVILIKDTALVFVLGVIIGREDIFGLGEEGYSAFFNATFWVWTAVAYLVVTLPLIGVVNAVERRLRSGLVGIAGAGN